jgi:hypothetical protein
LVGAVPASQRCPLSASGNDAVLLWIPKRDDKGGWSFYSVMVPFSLIMIMLVLVVLLVLRLLDALR